MEVPGLCEACGLEKLIMDTVYGLIACDSCGRVKNQAETELRSELQTGLVIERRGTFVGENDTGTIAVRGLSRLPDGRFLPHCQEAWSERSRFEMTKKVQHVSAMIRLSADKVEEVTQLLEAVLEGNWGTGRWADVAVATCAYIVIRQHNLPVTIPEVAECINCDVIELGRMLNRILQRLDLQLPEVDSIAFVERAASTLPALAKVNKERICIMIRQTSLLLEYARRFLITSGRRPLPIVAAAFTLAAEANKIVVVLEEVSQEIYAGVCATKTRYRELMKVLVGVGQDLPWGKDISIRTVPRHLPFILQFLEVKLKHEKKRKWQATQECLVENSACEKNHPVSCATPLIGTMVISTHQSTEKSLSYNYISNLNSRKCLSTSKPNFSGQEEGSDQCESSPVDNSGSCPTFGVGPEAFPPSFCASVKSRVRRHAKLIAAKARILEARQGLLQRYPNASCVLTSLDPPFSFGQKSQQPSVFTCKGQTSFDLEDLIIEKLVLFGADESEIENGYYQALLARLPQQKTEVVDSDIEQYLRNKTEVELVQDLTS